LQEQKQGGKIMFSKFMRALRKGHRDERGITGLETAIILIAFVTVAAVFGYAVLSAGIFSSEKGKETVYLGLEEAKSTMVVKGSVIATSDNASPATKVAVIYFDVGNSVGGNAIDLNPPPNNRCILNYVDANQYVQDGQWTVNWIGNHNDNNLLEIGETAEIVVDLDTINGGAALDSDLGINQKFTIEFKPPSGAVVTVERTVPAGLNPIMDLH
jgi:flagellin FlaB